MAKATTQTEIVDDAPLVQETGTAVATRQNTDVGEAGGGFMDSLGRGGIRSEDMVLPRVKLLQQMSGEVTEEKGKSGEWYDPATEMNYGRAIVFIPADKVINRVRFGDDISEGLLCRSLDMETGQGDPGDTLGVGGCNRCPLKDWGADRTPPSCGESHNWFGLIVAHEDRDKAAKDKPPVMIDLDIPEMAILSFRSTATKAAKQWTTLHMRRSIAASTQGRDLKWFETRYTISTELQVKDALRWYVPVVKQSGASSAEERNAVMGVMAALNGKKAAFVEPEPEDFRASAGDPAANEVPAGKAPVGDF